MQVGTYDFEVTESISDVILEIGTHYDVISATPTFLRQTFDEILTATV